MHLVKKKLQQKAKEKKKENIINPLLADNKYYIIESI